MSNSPLPFRSAPPAGGAEMRMAAKRRNEAQKKGGARRTMRPGAVGLP